MIILNLRRIAAVLILPIIWIGVKYGFGIPDRYLPAPWDVVASIGTLRPPFLLHVAVSWLRLCTGYIVGVAVGLAIGIAWWRSPAVFAWTNPSAQALRSVPATATVPFFILWLGFSEVGRLLLIVMGIALNIGIATYQTLGNVPRKYLVALHSAGLSPRDVALRQFALPIVVEALLPTLRFALSTAIGLVVVSEILGSQSGLGYLIQTARSTFSLHLVFLAALAFGVINVASDSLVQLAWRTTVFWRQNP
jgi:ABC-type nitrate/sulfonate/bicarbonate transport system permease component